MYLIFLISLSIFFFLIFHFRIFLLFFFQSFFERNRGEIVNVTILNKIKKLIKLENISQNDLKLEIIQFNYYRSLLQSFQQFLLDGWI